MQNGFGSGYLVGTALTDAYGATLTTPLAVQFGVLQDVSLDVSFEVKELYGQQQFPVAIGRGKGKIGMKAKFAQINGLTINALLFGQTLTAGTLAKVIDSVGTAIPTTPFQITPTVPSSGTWTQDQGVLDNTGLQMTRVVSAPVTGQYAVTAGVYTFAAADVGKVVRIDFLYTATSTLARKLAISNLTMGTAPTFRADFVVPFNGKQSVITFNSCTMTKFAMATKLDDFMVPELDFSAFADAAGNVGTLSFSE